MEKNAHPVVDYEWRREYGIVGAVDQMFDAPPLIKHLLARVCRVNT